MDQRSAEDVVKPSGINIENSDVMCLFGREKKASLQSQSLFGTWESEHLLESAPFALTSQLQVQSCGGIAYIRAVCGSPADKAELDSLLFVERNQTNREAAVRVSTIVQG